MTFYGWLMQQSTRLDPVGDLARRVKAEVGLMPRFSLIRAAWENYAMLSGMSMYLRAAVITAWDEYEADCKEYRERTDCIQT